MPPKRVTITDIAKESGLSIGAVSQCLRPTPGSSIRVPPDTVARIRKIAEKLNYRPHAAARATRLNRFNNLGFFIAKEKFTYLPQDYLDGLHDAALSHGFSLTLLRLPDDPALLKENLPAIFREQSIDALILGSYNLLTAVFHKEIRNAQFPIVYLNDKFEHNSVYIDEEAGIRMLVQHLIKRGYKNIQYTYLQRKGNPPLKTLHHSVRDRLSAYRRAMKELGYPANVVKVPASQSESPFAPVTLDQLFPNGRPDAIISYADNVAATIGKTLYREGIRIPNDLALTGYNCDIVAQAAWVDLTGAKVPAFEMGHMAVEMAVELINSKSKKKIKSRKIPPTLHIGDSTRRL